MPLMLTLSDEDKGDVGDVSRYAPSRKGDLAHRVDGRAPGKACQSKSRSTVFTACSQREIEFTLALDLDSQDGE